MNSSIITRAGFEFQCGLLHFPSVRLSLAVPWLTLEPGCLTLGKQLRVDSGLPTTPADYGPAEPPGRVRPTPGPRRFASHQAVAGLLRNLIPLAVPELVSGFAALFTRLQRREDSGMSTTPADYGSAEPPGRRPPAPGPQLFRTPQAVPRITPDLILLAVPRARLSLTVLFTRPRCRLDFGRPRTPARLRFVQNPLALRRRARSRLLIAQSSTISRWLTGHDPGSGHLDDTQSKA